MEGDFPEFFVGGIGCCTWRGVSGFGRLFAVRLTRVVGLTLYITMIIFLLKTKLYLSVLYVMVNIC